jgi:hypothetical protein
MKKTVLFFSPTNGGSDQAANRNVEMALKCLVSALRKGGAIPQNLATPKKLKTKGEAKLGLQPENFAKVEPLLREPLLLSGAKKGLLKSIDDTFYTSKPLKRAIATKTGR